MPIDRASILKNAETLLRQGKLDLAIAEYLRVVEDEPHDWATANILGDLYVRAGRIDAAVDQFIRIADGLQQEGFLPRAAALHKKILKLRPGDDRASLAIAEIAATQGRTADARVYLQSVLERRRTGGDPRGSAEILARMSLLDSDDVPARILGVRARLELADRDGALRELKTLATHLQERNRHEEALPLLDEAAALAPDDPGIRRGLFAAHVARGDYQRARESATTLDQYKELAARFEAGGHADLALDTLQEALCVDSADADLRARLARAFMRTDARASEIPAAIARDPERLLALAAAQVQSGRVDEGLALLRDMVKTDVERRRDVATLAIDIAVQQPDAGFHLTELVAGAEIAEANWHDAAAVLQSFVAAAPGHIPALARLADVAAAGVLEGTLSMARVQLADAYLAAGMGAEAQVIVADLVAREPWERAHIERFRHALILSGVADADMVIAQRLRGTSPFASVDLTIDQDPSVITTSDDAGILMTEAFGVDEPLVQKGVVAPTDDLEHVFARLRDEAVRRSELEEAAEESYRSGLAICDAGQSDAAIPLLEAAAQSPRLRFVAAAHAGRLHRDLGDVSRAIEWFERAMEGPAPDVTEGRLLLYDLAVALESAGEVARALAVCIELQSEAGSYRDISDRIDRLARVQVGG